MAINSRRKGAAAGQDCKLIRLAGEMVRSQSMPSPFLEDWKLPKRTPRSLMRQIKDAALKCDEQCKSWAIQIRGIVDAMRKVSAPDTASELEQLARDARIRIVNFLGDVRRPFQRWQEDEIERIIRESVCERVQELTRKEGERRE